MQVKHFFFGYFGGRAQQCSLVTSLWKAHKVQSCNPQRAPLRCVCSPIISPRPFGPPPTRLWWNQTGDCLLWKSSRDMVGGDPAVERARGGEKRLWWQRGRWVTRGVMEDGVNSRRKVRDGARRGGREGVTWCVRGFWCEEWVTPSFFNSWSPQVTAFKNTLQVCTEIWGKMLVIVHYNSWFHWISFISKISKINKNDIK